MIVVWTPEADQDRIDIWSYIAADNPSAAADMDERFSDAVAKLPQHPRIGKPGRILGTRELFPHEHYVIVYEIVEDVIWIQALVHTAKQWPFISR